VPDAVVRQELSALHVLQFIREDAVPTAVTTSHATDTHGRELSTTMLETELPECPVCSL